MFTLRIINLGEIMEENEWIDSEKLVNLMPLNQLALKLVDKPDTVGEIAVIETLHKRISATIIHWPIIYSGLPIHTRTVYGIPPRFTPTVDGTKTAYPLK